MSNTHPRIIRTLRHLGLAAALLLGAQTASAQMASGNAWDLNVSLSVLGINALNVPAQAHAQFNNSAAAFQNSQSVVSVNQASAPLALAHLTTGALNASTEFVPGRYNVVGSDASAANVNLGAISALIGGTNLLSLTATQIHSSTIVGGYCPAPGTQTESLIGDIAADKVFLNGFEAAGLQGLTTTSTPGLGISVAGTSFGSLLSEPPANTTISLPGGIATLVLREQTVTGDGITSLAVAANGLHLSVNVVGLIVGDIVIAHSEASINCAI